MLHIIELELQNVVQALFLTQSDGYSFDVFVIGKYVVKRYE